MRKLILMVAFGVLMFTSCNKTELASDPLHRGEKVKLSISVAKPTSAVGSPGVNQSVPLSGLITQLSYVLFSTKTGVEVARVTQFSTDPQFGQLAITLERGEYYMVAVGSNSEFGINQYYKANENPVLLKYSEANMEYWQGGPSMAEKHYKTSDTFFAKSWVVVGEPQQVIMELERVVAKLEIAVDDVKDYWVNIRSEATGFMFDSGTSIGRVEDESFTVKSADGPISLYIMQTTDPLYIVIGYGRALSEQINLSLRMEKNKRTIVRGNLLKSVRDGFSVTVDDRWISEPNIVEL